MKKIISIKKYFSTHFAASFIMILACMVMLMIIVLQSYLKNEYFQYLIEETYETQNAVMIPMQKSINNSLQELITRGSEIAIDSSLYDLVKEYGDNEEGKKAEINRLKLSIADALEIHAYSTNAVTIAIAGAEGLVTQYDRYRSIDGSLWNDENNYILQGISEKMTSEVEDRVFPRIWTDSEQDTHHWYTANRIFHVVYPLTGGKASIWDADYVLVISYSMNIFDGFLDAVEIPGVEYIRGYVSDQNGNIVYHNDSSYIGASEPAETMNERISHISSDLKYFGWTLNIIIDEAKMQEHIDEIYNSGVLVYAALRVLVIVVI